MGTLLNLFYAAPVLFGMLIVLVALIVIHTPWRLLWECLLLANAAMVILITFWISEVWRKFKRWMRKPASWENDLPDLWI
jgi:hypothetical protein